MCIAKHLFILLLVLVLFLVGGNSFLYAQFYLDKDLGKINDEWLSIDVYSEDSSAGAFVISKKVLCEIQSNLDQYYTVRTTIKVLNEKGYYLANQTLANATKEIELKELRALAYNIYDDGTVDTSEVLAEDVLTSYNKNNKTVENTFVIPNVSKGTIIDYYYKYKISEYPILNPELFQDKIPIANVEYFAISPINISFNAFVNNENYLKDSFITIDSTAGINKLYLKFEKIPAFEQETFTSPSKNYFVRASFIPNQRFLYDNTYREFKVRWFRPTWEFEFDNFIRFKSGGYTLAATSGKYYKSIADSLYNINNDREQFIKNAYNYLIQNLEINGEALVPEANSFKKVIRKGKATIAEANFLFWILLNSAGVDADLVFMSTRNNGMVFRLDAPSFNKLNYMAVQYTLNNKTYIASLENTKLPLGTLPAKCINGNAIKVQFKAIVEKITKEEKVQPSEMSWIDTGIAAWPETSFTNINMAFLKEGTSIINYSHEIVGYQSIEKIPFDSTKFKIALEDNAENWNLESITTHKPTNTGEAFKVDALLKNDMGVDLDVDLLYVPINIDNRWTSNPFIYNERRYDIDFKYPRTETYILTIQIPEGYEVEDLPGNVLYQLPDKSAKFIFGAKVIGRTIKISSSLQLKKAIYAVESYEGLKDLFSYVTSRFNEIITLKKAP